MFSWSPLLRKCQFSGECLKEKKTTKNKNKMKILRGKTRRRWEWGNTGINRGKTQIIKRKKMWLRRSIFGYIYDNCLHTGCEQPAPFYWFCLPVHSDGQWESRLSLLFSSFSVYCSVFFHLSFSLPPLSLSLSLSTSGGVMVSKVD